MYTITRRTFKFLWFKIWEVLIINPTQLTLTGGHAPQYLVPLTIQAETWDCFHTRAKCKIWMIIRIAQFEWSFESQYFGPCVRKITSRCLIWIAQFKWRSGGVSSDASHKSRIPIAIWMPWPLNCDLGGGGGGATWPSNHFRYVQKHRKRELHACLIGRVPRHEPRIFSRSGMLNSKFGLSCVHCVIQISQLLLSCVPLVIQIAQFKWSFKFCSRVKTQY